MYNDDTPVIIFVVVLILGMLYFSSVKADDDLSHLDQDCVGDAYMTAQYCYDLTDDWKRRKELSRLFLEVDSRIYHGTIDDMSNNETLNVIQTDPFWIDMRSTINSEYTPGNSKAHQKKLSKGIVKYCNKKLNRVFRYYNSVTDKLDLERMCKVK